MRPRIAIGTLAALSLIAGCGSDTTETEPAGDAFTYASLSVTLVDNQIRSCTSQFSVDQDGNPFGHPSALVAITVDPGPAEATLFAYHTDEPPTDCPPSMVEPIWSGAPGDEADLSDAPITFGPGSAFTLQADCDACQGDNSFKATMKLKKL